MMTIYILRHGETDLNAKSVMQGRLDEPLNERGRELAVLSGRGIQGVRFDRCVSSPLKRARETAELVLKESRNDIPVTTDERIIEIDFGEFEGKKLPYDEFGRSFYTDPLGAKGFPGGESVRDVCKRAQAFLKELIDRDDDKIYLISTHGCALRAMTNFFFEDGRNFWRGHVPYNCSFSIVSASGKNAELVAVDKVFYDEDLIVDRYVDDRLK